MKIITSQKNLATLPKNHSSLNTIQKLLNHIIESNNSPTRSYDPAQDGYLILIEKSDLDRPLTEIVNHLKLVDISFEGVTKIDGFFNAVYVPNNQFALSFLIPDESWIPEKLRKHLEYHLDEN